jgi:transposase
MFFSKNKKTSRILKNTKFEMMELFPKLGEGVRLVELFDDFYAFDDKEQAAAFLAWWCDQVEDSGIFPFRKFINTVRTHWSGIVNWYDDKISNGILEGINSKIQLAKKRARGFRNIENFINMIYFIAGNLDFNYPLKTL